MKVRISSVRSVLVLIEMDQEDVSDLTRELDAAISEQKDQLRWPVTRELLSRLEEMEEEEKEEEEEEDGECDCESLPHNLTDKYCSACGGVLAENRKMKKKATPKKK